MKSSNSFSRRRIFAAVSLLGVVVALAVFWQSTFPRETPSPAKEPAAVTSREPESSFATLRHVIATGGVALTREAAIAWLDRQARQRESLSTEAENCLLDLLRDGDGHPDWSPGYRQHIFNSACNALRVGHSASSEAFAHILHSHAVSHPDRVLRLYALQHIDSLRKSGQLQSPLAEEIHATLQSLAASPESDVAGTAIHLLAGWDGPVAEAPHAVLELAAHTASDRSRSIDVRVSAIHSAGPAALDAARAIATDSTEPVLLRKAAIARIGRHGDQEDLTTLKSLSSGSARLAQAANPALESLRLRLRQPDAPAPIPYP